MNFYKKGFTLIELLVSIAILGILSSIILARIDIARSKARDARREGDIKQLKGAIENYFSYCYVYPSSIAALGGTALCPAYTIPLFAFPTDPKTGASYNYYADNSGAAPGKRFHLCATLENVNVNANSGKAKQPPFSGGDPCNGVSATTFDVVGGAM